jgi:hypothetical protein
MIANLLCETCTIKHRQGDSRDSFNQYDYWLETDVPCLAVDDVEYEKEDLQSINITDILFLYIIKVVTEMDRIIYDGYEYGIYAGGVKKGKDVITGEVEYYLVHLDKKQAHPPTIVEIKRR